MLKTKASCVGTKSSRKLGQRVLLSSSPWCSRGRRAPSDAACGDGAHRLGTACTIPAPQNERGAQPRVSQAGLMRDGAAGLFDPDRRHITFWLGVKRRWRARGKRRKSRDPGTHTHTNQRSHGSRPETEQMCSWRCSSLGWDRWAR